VFAYKNSVIKTFTPGRSPFRNCAPGTENEKWPTEIAASLRFGGHDNNINNAGVPEGNAANNTIDGFLPVRAYFKAATPPSLIPEWHLVTPLLKGGNLNTLAKKALREAKLKTAREIDAHYRPAFEHLLSNMQYLHEARYCHDDIKPANIFVAEDTQWLLGDLGNLRHISHPYHSSRIWTDNDQITDCRANDAMRLLKSYLQFVKAAASDKEHFDEDFFAGEEPVSRLFWKASADAPNISAAQIRKHSMIVYPEQSAMLQENDEFTRIVRKHPLSRGTFRPSTLHKAVNTVLETRMGEKLARWWGMVGIFGVPNNEVCGF
jgi:serine/threonine protein kinase